MLIIDTRYRCKYCMGNLENKEDYYQCILCERKFKPPYAKKKEQSTHKNTA